MSTLENKLYPTANRLGTTRLNTEIIKRFGIQALWKPDNDSFFNVGRANDPFDRINTAEGFQAITAPQQTPIAAITEGLGPAHLFTNSGNSKTLGGMGWVSDRDYLEVTPEMQVFGSTLFAIARPGSIDAQDRLMCAVRDSRMTYRGSDNTLGHVSGVSTSRFGLPTSANDGQLHSFVMIWKSQGTSPRLFAYFDGLSRGQAPGPTLLLDNDSFFAVGNTTPGAINGFFGTVVMAGASTLLWTDQMVTEWHNNPMAVFYPRTISDIFAKRGHCAEAFQVVVARAVAAQVVSARALAVGSAPARAAVSSNRSTGRPEAAQVVTPRGAATMSICVKQ